MMPAVAAIATIGIEATAATSSKEAETKVVPGEAASNQRHHQEGGCGDGANSDLRQLRSSREGPGQK